MLIYHYKTAKYYRSGGGWQELKLNQVTLKNQLLVFERWLCKDYVLDSIASLFWYLDMPLKYTICLGSLFNPDLCPQRDLLQLIFIMLKLRLPQEDKHVEKLICTQSSLLFMLFQRNILPHFMYPNHEIGLYSCIAAVPGKKHNTGQRKMSK